MPSVPGYRGITIRSTLVQKHNDQRSRRTLAPPARGDIDWKHDCVRPLDEVDMGSPVAHDAGSDWGVHCRGCQGAGGERWRLCRTEPLLHGHRPAHTGMLHPRKMPPGVKETVELAESSAHVCCCCIWNASLGSVLSRVLPLTVWCEPRTVGSRF